MKTWIIKFCHEMILSSVSVGSDGEWTISKGVFGRIRYWNGGSWTSKYDKVKRYKTQEAAEKKAFKLTLRNHSLIGMIEVVPFAPVPISRPKR